MNVEFLRTLDNKTEAEIMHRLKMTIDQIWLEMGWKESTVEKPKVTLGLVHYAANAIADVLQSK